MSDSILNDVKKFIGFDEEYKVFDPDIKLQINSLIATLSQVGLTLTENFSVETGSETWDDYFSKIARAEDSSDSITKTAFEMAKNYIYINTKIVFDPPSSSFVLDALKSKASELEWRLSILPTTRIYDV